MGDRPASLRRLFASFTALVGVGKKAVKDTSIRYVGSDRCGYPATVVAAVALDGPGSGVKDSIQVQPNEKKKHRDTHTDKRCSHLAPEIHAPP